MPPRSPLSIATGALERLTKEEKSYHQELKEQEARVEKVKGQPDDEEGNKKYQLKQEHQVLEQTKGMISTLKDKIVEAMAKLEQQLETVKNEKNPNPEEITKAKEVLAQAKSSYREIA
ncbi:MAG: hypothetical protein M1834_008281 [Cirrosporium novae-zelandiae]|nr:MAG: hypothetical protein M1834_008281 [Cirrosporium novae-zelandiae]